MRASVTARYYFLSNVGRLQGANGGPAPSLLVRDGDIPEADGEEAQPWTMPKDGRIVQDLYAHTADNTPAYRRWRRPYVEGLGADPWGARYRINVGCLTAGGTGYVTIVMSPGPDGLVDAAFRSKILPARQSDDVIGLVATGKDGGAPSATGRSAGMSMTPAMTNLCIGAGAPR